MSKARLTRRAAGVLAAAGLLCVSIADASHPALRVYGERDGIPQSQVNAVIRDGEGYLWVGTSSGGAARYDGRQWQVFGDLEGLPGDDVSAFAIDTEGHLLAATDGGAARFVGGSFHRFPPAADAPASVRVIAAEPGGRVWLGGVDGLWLWDSGARRLRRIAEPASMERPDVQALAPDGAGGIWIGTGGGLLHGDAAAGAAERVDGLPARPVAALLKRPSMPLLIGWREAGVGAWDGKTLTRIGDDRRPGQRIRALTSDPGRSGEFWVGTADAGVACWTGAEFTQLGPDEGLPSKFIFAIYRDEEGICWLGTDDGLVKLSPSTFITFDRSDGLPPPDPMFGAAESLDGSDWFGADQQGLVRFLPSGKFERITSRGGLPDDVISDVVADPRGGVWVGSALGLTRIDGERMTTYRYPESIVRNVGSILPLPDGRVLLATFSNGVQQLTRGKIVFFPSPAGRSVTSLAVDRSGTIWIGGVGWGVVGIEADGSIAKLTSNEGLPSARVTNINVDASGGLWISTERGVWHRFPTGRTEVLTRATGLPDSFAYWARSDRDGNVWIGTNRGVARRSADGGLRVFTTKDGLASDECNDRGVLCDSKGRVFVSTMGLSMSRGLGRGNPWPPPITIEKASVGNRDLSRFDGVLPHDFAPLTIHFAALSYLDESAIRFRYRLAGLASGAWIEPPPGVAETSYAALAPGNYRFEVVAVAADGGVSRKPAVLTFRVGRAWWMTPPALGAAATVLIGGLAGIVRTRERRHRNARRGLEATVNRRTQELQEANSRLARLVITDALTGIASRRYVLEKLDEAIRGARRKGRLLAVALADLDRFKRVNDTLGHLEGDRFLRLAAEAMQRVLRAEDLLGRYGGEEFLAILHVEDLDGAAAAGERIRNSIAHLPFAGADSIFPGEGPSVSIGVALYDGTDIEGGELVRRADEALYGAKADGRNRVRLWQAKPPSV